MKLWVDAEREPDVRWVWARTAHCAVTMIRGGCVERVSLPPDQRPLAAEVTDWITASGVEVRTGTHSRTGGARNPRGSLRCAPVAFEWSI